MSPPSSSSFKPVRRLPISVPPALNETTTSYLQRLATNNRITLKVLHDLLGINRGLVGLHLQPHHISRLAVATGYPKIQLDQALPQLTNRHTNLAYLLNWPRPACQNCARHYPGGRVMRYYPPSVHCCPKHRVWISSERYSRGTADISGTPEVIAAHTRHRRLTNQFGPKSTQYAFATAREVWGRISYDEADVRGIDRRLEILGLNPDGRVSLNDPRHLAASYPEVVDMCGFLVSARWQQAASRRETLTLFLATLGNLLAGKEWMYWPNNTSDPIGRWVDHLIGGSIPWGKVEPPPNFYLLQLR
ncbi:TniQ family protein [Nocardia sp. Root136]|uniref:TniQ family protein n=1 Tax=Nocardia sp. Root136 TaxID=1736458 RepID=UPI000A01C069|nr:TniQ family protein [Nocardia sp. Root136]